MHKIWNEHGDEIKTEAVDIVIHAVKDLVIGFQSMEFTGSFRDFVKNIVDDSKDDVKDYAEEKAKQKAEEIAREKLHEKYSDEQIDQAVTIMDIPQVHDAIDQVIQDRSSLDADDLTDFLDASIAL